MCEEVRGLVLDIKIVRDDDVSFSFSSLRFGCGFYVKEGLC
jgi:hypothetical protein